MERIPIAMTIAGSDSGAGAGIQADLKTFAALGVYGTSVLTAVTAQNTQGVSAVHEIPDSIIAKQIDSVISDISTKAVKIGMLSNSGIIRTVVGKIKDLNLPNLVVDPVMVAKGGDRLLQEEAIDVLRNELLPLAVVATPNIPETEALTGIRILSVSDARWAAEKIIALGAKNVVVKGGHLDGDATDIFYDGMEFREFSTPRIETANTHGTGCTFAAAIAAGLAKEMSPIEAVAAAKEYVTQGIKFSFAIGRGHGPLNHFFDFWRN